MTAPRPGPSRRRRRRGRLVPALAACLGLVGPGTVRGQNRPIVREAEPRPAVQDVGQAGTGTQSAPQVHVVRKGDTLWDLSAYYLGNPWRWPKVWSYNPKITNPHWIYPGDLIRFYPESGPRLPVAGAPEPAREERPARPETLRLRDRGFVTDEELRASGTIVGSREERLMLATHDQAYVEFKRGLPGGVRPGQRFTIYRVLKRTTHPRSGERVGHQVEVVGVGEVVGRPEKGIVRMRIVETLNPIERGFRVGPLRNRFLLVPPRQNRRRVEGHIIETFLAEGKLAGEHQLVYVDRGKQDGVELGNRFFVVRRGDGFVRRLEQEQRDRPDTRFPEEILAEIQVVEVGPRFSTALVTRSLKEVRVGDRVQMRPGY